MLGDVCDRGRANMQSRHGFLLVRLGLVTFLYQNEKRTQMTWADAKKISLPAGIDILQHRRPS